MLGFLYLLPTRPDSSRVIYCIRCWVRNATHNQIWWRDCAWNLTTVDRFHSMHRWINRTWKWSALIFIWNWNCASFLPTWQLGLIPNVFWSNRRILCGSHIIRELWCYLRNLWARIDHVNELGSRLVLTGRFRNFIHSNCQNLRFDKQWTAYSRHLYRWCGIRN